MRAGLTLIAVIAVVGVGLILAIRPPEEWRPPLPARPVVAEADNAWPLLVDVARLFEAPRSPAAGEDPNALEYLAPQLERNQEALAALRAALRRPALQVPAELGLGDRDGPAETALRQAIQATFLLELEARRLRAVGEPAAAVARRLEMLELGRRVWVGGGGRTTCRAGERIIRSACGALIAGLLSSPPPIGLPLRKPPTSAPPRLTSAECAALRKAITSLLADRPDRAATSTAIEYEIAVTAHRLADGRTGPQGDGIQTIARRATDEPSRRRAAKLLRTRSAQIIGGVDLSSQEWRDLAGTWVRGHSGWSEAQALARCRTPVASRHALRLVCRGTAAALACRLYYHHHGRLPDDWDQLRDAGLLPAAPLDQYPGRPLIYRPAEGVILSSGPDGALDAQDPQFVIPVPANDSAP